MQVAAMIGGDYQPLKSSVLPTPPPLIQRPLEPHGFFSGAIFSGHVVINFGSGSAEISSMSTMNRASIATTAELTATQTAPSPLMICAPSHLMNSAPTNFQSDSDGISAATSQNDPVSSSEIVLTTPNTSLEGTDIDSDDEESSQRISFTQQVRDLPPKRTRVQSEKYA